MKAEDLNVKKAVLLISIVSALALFILSMKVGNGVSVSLVFSLVAAIPTAWVIGLLISAIYELLKLFKPILDWLYR
jgi:hypothetical protein